MEKSILNRIFWIFISCIFFISMSVSNKLYGQIEDSLFIYSVNVAKSNNNEPCIFPLMIDSDNPAPAVLIFPGGGYANLSFQHEGSKVAKWFNERGINAFVMKYRTGKFDGKGNLQPDMLNDAINAIQIIRKNYKKWNIDPTRIGVIGFSAGAHLAATLSVHFEDKFEGRIDYDPNISAQPNFCILAYPVITMNDKFTHWGSRRHSLGTNPTKDQMLFYSPNLQVKPNTPPTFIFHTSDDKSVPVQNSILYYLALKEMGIPVEIHVFQHGTHGVGLASNDETLSQWSSLLSIWLKNWNFSTE